MDIGQLYLTHMLLIWSNV